MSKKYPPPPPATGAQAVLREFALSFPDAVEEFPWGHRVMKVRGKMFVIFGGDESALRIAIKLPKTGKAALERPNCEPTPYGMGKHGWVTSSWPPFQEPDVELVSGWIAESYEAIASATPAKRAKKAKATRSKPVTKAKPARKVTPARKLKNAKQGKAAKRATAARGAQRSRTTRSTKTRR